MPRSKFLRITPRTAGPDRPVRHTRNCYANGVELNVKDGGTGRVSELAIDVLTNNGVRQFDMTETRSVDGVHVFPDVYRLVSTCHLFFSDY